MKYRHDKQAADRIVKFLEQRCTHVKGELSGQTVKLEKWQKEIFGDIFGWKRPDGTRRYRMAYIEVPRKNGKTTLSAGAGLYMLFADGEKGAEVYSAAANKEQANIAFEIASLMCDGDSRLGAICTVLRKSIYVKKTASRFMSLSKESKTKHGLNASCVIVDELHAHPDRELFDVLTTSTGSRREPLIIVITTAGIKDESSIGWVMHEKARQIINGTIKDDSFYAKIYGATDEDDPSDEKVWRKANPNYGVSVKKGYIKDQWTRVSTEPSYLNTFKRLHLNMWTGSYEAFISPNVWARCNLKKIHQPENKPCIMALDLAAISDFNALATAFWEDEMLNVIMDFWIPEDSIEGRHNKTQIRAWVDGGYITATPGNVSDYDYIRQCIIDKSKKFHIQEIAYDPWNSRQLIIMLENDGANCVEHRQGYVSMSPAMKEMERMVLAKKLNHGGNPVLAWMNDNLVFSTDPAGNIKPDKKNSSDKIDGVVAAIMATGRAIFYKTEGTSVYESEEDLIL